MKAEWNTTDRILYGVMVGAFVVGTVSMFIEACRSRPKVKMIVLGVPKSEGKEKEVKQPAKSGLDESSSAPENQ